MEPSLNATLNEPPERPAWRDAVDPYARADTRRASIDLLTSVVPYLAITVAMYLLIDSQFWVTFGLIFPAAGFLLRSFIVFHDCTHGSFMPTKAQNRWLGRFTAFLVWQPFANWRHDHAVHHGTAGDLDRRGQGDVPTLTVDEYYSKSWPGRLGYRLFRNPLVMFGVGPIWSLMIGPRFWSSNHRPRQRRSVQITNVAVALGVAALVVFLGWFPFLIVQIAPALLAGMAGVWLFYVQHQFEDVYWENSDRWEYSEAALRGSSYLKLPKILQFFTGNIGLHHVHHLSAKIPNYNLQRAHDELEMFQDVPVLTIREGLRCSRLKLIDPGSGRLLTWTEARELRQAPPAAAPATQSA